MDFTVISDLVPLKLKEVEKSSNIFEKKLSLTLICLGWRSVGNSEEKGIFFPLECSELWA